MKADRKIYSALEEIYFKNECIEALIECIQMLVAEGLLEIRGICENTLPYSLYEIENSIRENNKKLGEIIKAGEIIKCPDALPGTVRQHPNQAADGQQ